MKKILMFLLIISTFTLTSALGDRWDLIFSDGTTTINGTDVCLESGLCLSQAIAGSTGDITGVTTAGPYLVGGTLSGQVDLLLNETYLNETITLIASAYGGGNSSFNQTLTDTLYAPISVVDTDTTILTENQYNSTQFNEDSGQLNIILSWFSSQFDLLFGAKDTDDLTEGSVNLYDNQSWTEAVADGKYALIGAGADNSSWNESYANTLYAPISVVDTDTNCSVDGSCGLITYDSELNYYTDADIDGTETAFDGWDKDASNDFSGSWNDLTDIPAGFSDGIDNQSTGGVDWTEITSKPAGFDDDVDNDTTYSALSEFSNDVGYITNDTMNKTVSCSDIVGSPDSDFCTDDVGADGYNTTEEMQDAVGSAFDNTLEYNDGTDSMGVNMTYINETISLLDTDTDTTYDAGSNLSLVGTTFSLDVDGVLAWLDTLFTRTSNLVTLLGNWSADKSDYSTTAEADLLYAPISVVDTTLNESEVEAFIFDDDNTGDMLTTGNVTAGYFCLNAGCTSYMYNNGTHTIIK